MGNLFSVFGSFYYNNSSINTPTAIDHICGPTTTGNGSGRKRTASGHFSETQPICAKRFKLNTLHYVYQKLFVEGLNSDVFVHALGHTWKLHRLYLEQCDYFRALFQGNWSDSGNNEYNLAIEDENICFTGLNNVFASLYNNEIEIDEQHIAGVCGAASMLSLNSVLDKCNLHLAEYVRQKDKMLICLRLADRYGFEERMNEALDFLKFTLCQFCTDPEFLRGLHPNWLIKLLAGEFICVRENELDLYLAIRNWIFLRECPDGQMSDEQAQRQLFNSPKFEWRKYWQVLRHIRVAHLCNLASTLERISADGLIPKEMIGRVVGVQWETLLRSEEMPIQGGNNANGGMDEVEDAAFYANCFRLGRTGVSAYSRTSWRWLGYFFGVDLLVSFDYGFLRLTRNCTVAPTQHQISIKHVESMKLHYRCIVCIGDGTVLLDTKKQSKMFNLDRSIELGAFKLPSKSEPICVHLFYLPFPPLSIHHSPQRQWDQLGSMEEQQSPPEFQ